MIFNKKKCKVLCLSRNNFQVRNENNRMGSSPTERNLWVLKDKKLTTSQYCAFSANVNNLQSYVRQSIDSRSAEEFLLLYSVLV